MATITLNFHYSDGLNGEFKDADFELEVGIHDVVEEKVAVHITELGDKWYLTGYSDSDDSEWSSNLEDFCDLETYAEYVENCNEYGEAYDLRFQDISEVDMEDYEGCWDSEEKYAQNYADECALIPDNLWGYMNWESYSRDLLRDSSTYEGKKGIHIFRN